MHIKNARMQLLICYYTLMVPIVSANWSPVEDIPIEYFQPEEYQESHIDHEILLRPSRTVASSLGQTDLKEQFFRSFGEDSHTQSELDERDLPKPGGFIPHSERTYSSETRRKRQVVAEPFITSTIRINTDIEDELGTGTLELHTLNPLEVSSELIPQTTETVAPEETSKSNFIFINDFLRFRRGAEKDSIENIKDSAKNEDSKGDNRPKRDRQTITKSAKLSLENENISIENSREPRGLTRQEWVKFPYQLQRSNEPYQDSSASASEHIKAPRVHFVTQRRSETVEAPLVYRNERQGRDSDLPREARENMHIRDREADFTPRFPRRYEPLPVYPEIRYDQRRDYFRNRYDERGPPEDRRFPALPPSPVYSANRQRRIIYYANLPEINRRPSNIDLRDRYRYRRIYDENSPNDPYQRKGYVKPRFDEIVDNKSPYPMKVSSDVNVREIKKNPERRILSEVNRKYNYITPTFNNNQGETRH